MYRQGDVLIVKTDMPATGQQDAGDRLVLRHGEATGHHHSVARAGAALYRPDDMPAGPGDYRLVIDGDHVKLEHQEHAPIALPPGTYRPAEQVEETPEAIRRVVD